MFLIEFKRDTELILSEPPYDMFFEKGEKIEATSWKEYMDMIIVQSLNNGELVIFNEDVVITEIYAKRS